MKFINFLKRILASLLFSLVRRNQQLPNDVVRKSFFALHPEARYATWQVLESAVWEVSFLSGYGEHIALFTETSEWIETRTNLNLNSVPKTVRESFEYENPFDGLQRVFRIENREGNFYEFRCDKGHGRFSLIFDGLGHKILDHIE